MCVLTEVGKVYRGCQVRTIDEMMSRSAGEWPFLGVVEWCSNLLLNPIGVARVAGFSLPILWNAAALPEQAEGASKAIFEALKSLPGGALLLRAVTRNMDGFFGVDVINAVNCRKVAELVLRREPPGPWVPPGRRRQ